jgi:NDP-sugar pyrophosphorylase family protein
MNLTSIRAKVNKAIILAGGHSANLSPLNEDKPVYMLPIFNRPLIEYTIDFLKNGGIKNVAIAGSIDCNILEYISFLRRNNGPEINIRYIDEVKPRGTAGKLHDLREFIGDESFLVLNCSTFIGDIDLYDFMAFHYAKGSIVTIVVNKAKRSSTEGINITKEGAVKGFSIIHSSRERRSLFKPVGIYIFDPLALEYIKEGEYFDIKEQLIPALKNASLPVYIYETNGYCRTINSIEDYYEIHREGLFNGLVRDGKMMEISDGIWVGENVTMSPKSYLFDPVFIGNNCTIEKNAQIIGPAVIGNGCKIGEDALVRESGKD